MDIAIQSRLEAAGFPETTVQELFGLTPEENELIETRLALSHLLRQLCREHRWTQKRVAERLGSDQSAVSKAEKSDPSISIEWMLKAVFALGASRSQVARALCE
jgi:predicted XRE-type DNA-binding protein